MSGIVGILNLNGAPVAQALLERLTQFMSYRGPDAQRVWCDQHVGLGHALLSHTPTDRATPQPHTRGDGVWICADARIDGRTELAQMLGLDTPGELDDTSDADWILRAYRRWGDGCLDYLCGDFSFVIWDGTRRRLFCARDRFGVKPFYYAAVGATLLLSNTLDCIRQHPLVSTRLNDAAIGDFLLFGHNRDATTTTFDDIRRLPPAHTLSSAGLKWRTDRYFSLSVAQETHYSDPRDYVDHFKALLSAAVSDRLRARSAAIYMSGGLDSPALAAAATGRLGNLRQPKDLKAYCLVYDRMPDDERRYSQAVADSLGIEIDHMPVDDYNAFERWTDPALRRPEPYDWPFLAMNDDSLARISRFSRLVLYGEDPDALLAPARLVTLLQTQPLAKVLSDVIGYAVTHRRRPPLGLGLHRMFTSSTARAPSTLPDWIAPEFAQRSRLLDRWHRRHDAPEPPRVSRAEAHRRLGASPWQRLFEVNDVGATTRLVEHSYPYLDVRVVRFTLSLPTYPWCIDKHLLRRALHGVVPESVCKRRKTPLGFDPLRAPLQQSASRWIDRFEATPQLADYVVRERIPPVTGIHYRSEESWLHLRPLILNQWLLNARM